MPHTGVLEKIRGVVTPDGRPLLRGVFEPTVPAGRRAFQGTRRGRRSPAPPWSGTRGAEGDVSDLILPSFLLPLCLRPCFGVLRPFSFSRGGGRAGAPGLPTPVSQREPLAFAGPTIMILPQVHLRKPCYDFYFLPIVKFDRLLGAPPGPARSPGGADPRTSLNHPIGSSDGRCVQRAGT